MCTDILSVGISLTWHHGWQMQIYILMLISYIIDCCDFVIIIISQETPPVKPYSPSSISKLIRDVPSLPMDSRGLQQIGCPPCEVHHQTISTGSIPNVVSFPGFVPWPLQLKVRNTLDCYKPVHSAQGHSTSWQTKRCKLRPPNKVGSVWTTWKFHLI